MTKLAFVTLPLIAGLLAGCHPDTAAPPPSRVVLVQPAAPAEGSQTATYSGEVRARHEAELAFRVPGRILSRQVEVGSEIRPGQALARLDPSDLQLAAQAARAQLASAESDLATTAAEKERYAGLLARKFVSQAAYDARENAYNAARSKLEQARAQAEISGNQAGYGTLSSEFPAIVTAVLVDSGQVVAAGQAVFRIARPEEKEIALAVPEGRLSEFQSARSFTAVFWANGSLRVRGELRELAPAADPATRSYAARVRLIDPPPGVKLGMTASVAVDAPAGTEIQLPLAAVLDHGKGPFVRVVADGKVASRPVSVARFDEQGARIVSGLSQGEQVIVAGAGRLSDGEPVTARPVTPTSEQR